jgi:non-specific serine/threonine protein kinase
MLHGGTPIGERKQLVERFQAEGGPRFFVLSLKAAGTGLTLTRARHVIHFDRWWNPAVENQASDRAYRIGQKNPVIIHPLICRGTIEENIHNMIMRKSAMADSLLSGGLEKLLLHLSPQELLSLVSGEAPTEE